jgi:acyl-CoA synthetase (AMP-forming)/AMP-acid ligase II
MYPVDAFHRQAKLTPNVVALEWGQESLSYKELYIRSQSLAVALQKIDPQQGSRVGICCYNHTDHLVAWLAVLAAAKVWVPLYPKNGQAELERAVDFTGMTILVADPETKHLVDNGKVSIVLTGDGSENAVSTLISQHLGQVPQFADLPLDGTQAIKFTGGSTGIPKGVMQTYRSWNAVITIHVHAWEMRQGDRFLVAAPITHGTSTYILPTLATGGTLVIVDRARPSELLNQLANNSIATTFLPPTLIYMMMEEPGIEGMRFDALRNLVYGSAPMRSEAIVRAQSLFGPCIASNYGQTEAPQIATMISASDLLREDKRASVGRETLQARVGVLDQNGDEVPTGEIGEIAIRGDLLMSGYWKQPEKTEQVMQKGWLLTGDLGSFDEEGFLFIKGRSKDMVITGGFNVYPLDVEAVLGKEEGVADCAVFGVPDEKWGEALQAAIQSKTGAALDATELLARMRQILGPVKTPKSIIFYDALPRNAYGKLQKQQLIDDFIATSRKTAS